MENQKLVKEICPTTTQDWVKNGALFVDVREKEEVLLVSFKVSNSINIPLSKFEDSYTEMPKNKYIVMVCKSGTSSLRAAGFLVNHGYNNVVNRQHGIIRWAEKGFPKNGNTSNILGNNFCCATDSCC